MPTLPRSVIESALSTAGIEACLVEDYARYGEDCFAIKVIYAEDSARIMVEILFELEDGTYNEAARWQIARELADSFVTMPLKDEAFVWALCFPGWTLED
jgi:hypothetical protein